MEVLVASAVLTVFMAMAAIIVQTGMRSLGEVRLRSEAVRIGQEKLEMARNLPYESIGTIGGIPAGPLPAHSEEQVGNVLFKVDISVLFIDDPFDGKAPDDLIPVDYKRVKVAVSWGGLFASREPVVLLTDVSPAGIETAEDQGTLSVLVFDSQGKAVSGAKVHIEATVNPVINMDVYTDEYGSVLIPGAPICNACYKINVSKAGYTTDRTYGTDEVDNPIKPHVSVLEGKVSAVSFAIDVVSSLTIKVTHDSTMNYAPFSGVQFILQGTKEIGRTADDDPVYKVSQSLVSGSGGNVTVSNIEWDNYTISLPSNSTVDYAGSWPLNPISVGPGSAVAVTMVVKAASPHSLLMQFLDELQQPTSGVDVQLTGMGLISTQSAGVAPNGDQSQVFFPNLLAGMYSFTIQGQKYATVSGSLQVNGDSIERFILATQSASP